ncbi:hypothetical protein CI109_105499 [Kwoniella shandongensis]|uniref:RNase III domain-containing protein n=1 Tax=Kwoniella shandongensis TaxID=1734106 RepID=A0A5M6C2G7_9TREE|nr:uncharacterized protein CI109_002220 [Kwoniella shandongensis]KAA5529327.1 hypothetical protein CI109_002220 [Kwoniella shandongensis]
MTTLDDDINSNYALVLLDEIDNFNWPPLPPITDDTLRRAAFTHKSALSSAPANDETSYEKLAHVGDSLLGVFVTILLQGLYPAAKKDVATNLRAKLVNRNINSAISEHYLLPSRVITGRAVGGTLRASIKETGEIFEAYLGALFYSYIKDNTTHTEGKHYLDQEDSMTTKFGFTSYGQAFDKFGQFLEPLFTPLAKALYDPNEIDRQELLELSEGAKGELHTLLSMMRLPIPGYETERFWPSWISHSERRGEHGMMWKSKVRVRLRDGQLFDGEGIGQNAKEAGNIAAYLAMQKIKSATGGSRRRW